MDLAAKVAFLRRREAYEDEPGAVDVVETHMSWVFLTERYAFKLKKPVRYAYLDYSTVDRRRSCCLEEVRLGRRTAASVYLGVVPLTSGPAGLAIGGDGDVVDWLVMMRRLPEAQLLSSRIAAGTATAGDAEAVAEVLAAFYAGAAPARWSGMEYAHRLRNAIVAAAGELCERDVEAVAVRHVASALVADVEALRPQLTARIAEGRVVDAHGDLRPEHVCLERPPVIVDCLEFDPELRLLDAASELSFFAMECARLGAAWFGDRVLAGYARRAGDRVPGALLALYRGQHALIRALIAARHVDDVPPADRARWRARAGEYLAWTGVAGAPAA